MTETTLLDRLCTICGVEPGYYDVWGKAHEVSAATKRALLASMEVPVDDDACARAALAEREARSWRRALPPVQVVRTGAASRIPITLPKARTRDALRWSLVPEEREARGAELRAADLPVLEEREIDGIRLVRIAFTLPRDLAPGYHRFELRSADGAPLEHARLRLIVAPERCYQPAALAGDGRVWGPAVQLYAVRSRRNWGVGDFSDVRVLVEACAELRADVLGLNPLHALYPHNPEHASPYSPSSRLFLNVLYIDVEAVPELTACEEAQQLARSPELQHRLRAMREGAQVDYAGVANAKLPVLECLYEHFRNQDLVRDTEQARAFRAFQRERGAALYRHALFEALQEHFHRIDPATQGWPDWPERYRNPESREVVAFATANLRRVEFFQYLQWQADRQLAAAGRRALELRLGVGLYGDLAVSVDRAGAEAWANQHLYAAGASIGAPPDEFNLKGQDWGLPPWIPDALAESGHEPFIAMLRANMRHTGALRIDHVMGLMRLFWIPNGMTPADGAYVRYPFADLLGIVALESQRNRCLVIGEDLGTVPDEVRAALAPLGVLSYRLFYFEKSANGEFRPPSEYPRQALAAVTTHDLPTLAAFWEGRDLQERAALNLFPSEAMREQQTLARTEERVRLLFALKREKLLPEGLTTDPASTPSMSTALALAVHRYAARSPAQIMIVQLEDVLGQLEQVNLPGTTSERPNWRYRLALDLEALLADARLRELAAALADEGRPKRRPVPPQARIPRATYRLQLNRDFSFADAAALVPYLQRLGISHGYLSPYLKARAGSPHGYDIVDHNALNPEIGNAEDYEHLCATLHAHGMAHILDMVPNHMGVGGDDNVWALDVLENGPASAYADFFDIDWQPLKSELRGRLLLPVLGAPYGRVLEGGELKLVFDADQGSLAVRYHQHLFPLDPQSYPFVLGHALERLAQALGREHPELLGYQTLITGFRNLPGREQRSVEGLEERRRDKEIHKQRLAELAARCPPIRSFVEENVAVFNGAPGEPASFDLLHELLEQQAYRPAHWRVAADEINYRRFFDINDLAGLRMENPQVFALTHRFVIDLIAQGKIAGLRIDHPDGLYDPAAYYRRLQAAVAAALAGEPISVDPPRPSSEGPRAGAGESNTAGTLPPAQVKPLYLVAEKILAGYEYLPEDWLVFGTTGYDFANLVNGLFVHAPSERALDRIYRRFLGYEPNFDELLYERKKLIMRVSLPSELNVLATRLSRIAEAARDTRDFTLTALRSALVEVVACFPVYRTYVDGERATATDRRYVEWAIAQAKKRSLAADITIFDFIRDVLLLERAPPSEQNRQAIRDFAMRFQQYTAPVMAKGLEDTSFYIHNRLVSLNEVGGDPRRFGVSIAAFHHANQERARRWPHTMLATSTHDNKRAEDVRARINVLSELAEEWWQWLKRWRRLNRSKKRRMADAWAPSTNDEYLLYQTLVGAWPLAELDEPALAAFCARIEAYMLKAVREAKVHTSWINPNTEYEQAVVEFVRALLAAPERNAFLADFLPFQRRIAWWGMLNSLSQTLLKLTVPGVPDIYQGSELWDFSLVDPDNRRPVDYSHRQLLLAGLDTLKAPGEQERAKRARALLDTLEDGRAKLHVIQRALALRTEHADVFLHGAYAPLATHGPRAEHLCAFARVHERSEVISLAPRWFSMLAPAREPPLGAAPWADTGVEAPAGAGAYVNALTGELVRPREREGRRLLVAAELLASFPVALLLKQ